MNKYICIMVSCIVFTAVFLGTTGCKPSQNPNPQPGVPRAPDGKKQPPAEPAKTPTADLLLGEVVIKPYSGDPSHYLNYEIGATVENAGSGTASGFSVWCTYGCPPGEPTASAGIDIVQGGYIAGNSRFTYRSPFHYMCKARPPTLSLTCTVKSAEGERGPYAVNVKF